MKKSILFLILLIFVNTVGAESPKEPTNITGERMEVLRRGEVTRFLGNVKFIRGGDVVTSDVMEHYEKKNYVVGKGNVHLTAYPEESVKLEAFSEQLTYDLESRKSILTGDPELIQIDEENPENKVKVEGEVIEVLGKEKTVHAEGDARVETAEMTATAKLLDYNYETRKIILAGNSPHIYQDDQHVRGDYWAEVITIFIDEERVIMEGNVKASIYPKSR